MSNKHHFGAKSDALEHCDFDETSNTLKLKFRSSPKEHEHQNCPKEIYDGLKAAESPGRFYHQKIRNQFKVTFIEIVGND